MASYVCSTCESSYAAATHDRMCPKCIDEPLFDVSTPDGMQVARESRERELDSKLTKFELLKFASIAAFLLAFWRIGFGEAQVNFAFLRIPSVIGIVMGYVMVSRIRRQLKRAQDVLLS